MVHAMQFKVFTIQGPCLTPGLSSNVTHVFVLQLSQQDERKMMQELTADAEQFTAWYVTQPGCTVLLGLQHAVPTNCILVCINYS